MPKFRVSRKQLYVKTYAARYMIRTEKRTYNFVRSPEHWQAVRVQNQDFTQIEDLRKLQKDMLGMIWKKIKNKGFE